MWRSLHRALCPRKAGATRFLPSLGLQAHTCGSQKQSAESRNGCHACRREVLYHSLQGYCLPGTGMVDKDLCWHW
ncbi:hypothetical protein EDD16DRAFT_1567587 [Pisolithus croceorrhizus]|nr:hypothetical protein EDD16DRAFT_1567587 [Pisolithus croceorrhizus]